MYWIILQHKILVYTTFTLKLTLTLTFLNPLNIKSRSAINKNVKISSCKMGYMLNIHQYELYSVEVTNGALFGFLVWIQWFFGHIFQDWKGIFLYCQHFYCLISCYDCLALKFFWNSFLFFLVQLCGLPSFGFCFLLKVFSYYMLILCNSVSCTVFAEEVEGYTPS